MSKLALVGTVAAIVVAALVAAGVSTAGARSQVAGGRGSGVAQAYVLTARLGPGGEVPHPMGARGASGTFSATITINGTRGSLAWDLSFSHLTGSALAAHVHLGA